MRKKSINCMWLVASIGALSLAFVWTPSVFRSSHGLRSADVDAVRRVIAESGKLELAIPSYRETHSAVLTNSNDIGQIAKSFQPVSSEVVDSSYAVGAGGNAIVITRPDVSDWTLVVGDRWGMSVAKEPDKTERWVRFVFDDDSLLKLCADRAGLAYPLLSDVFGE
jgi:hypothetical protein